LHTTPPVPHAELDVPAWQVPVADVQQPLGQLAALHLQVPETHCWPSPHAALVPHRQAPARQLSERNVLQVLVPHRHWPDASQLSLRVVLQDVQVAPLTPQVASDFELHVVPEQQPAEHDDAVHWHVAVVDAPTHSWPAPHCAPAPQRQVPCVAPHWLAVKLLHDQHCWPAVPHSEGKLVA